MKFWQEGMKNTSRVILILFLLVIVAAGIFFVAQKFIAPSPLQKLAAKDARWIAVITDSSVPASLVTDSELLSDGTLGVLLPRLWPGADRAKLAALVKSLPADTVVAGYADRIVAAMLISEKDCTAFAQGSLQATTRDGVCLLHTDALPADSFETKDGSLRSMYGAQLPDTKSAVRVLLTPNFPMADAVTAAAGGQVTPEVLFARSLAGQRFPIAMTLEKDAAGDLRLKGHVLMNGKASVPQNIQDARVGEEALRLAPVGAAFVALPLDPKLPSDMQAWLESVFGKDIAKMGKYMFLTQTEKVTPLDINPATLPTATLLVSMRPGSTDWQAFFAPVDKSDKEQIEKALHDTLSVKYGISETSTTLPDKSRGVLVTASMENIEVETESMSGTTMTTYTAKDEPRLVTVDTGESFRFGDPAVMSGTVLQVAPSNLQETAWQLPIDMEQNVMMRLPFGEAGRQVYIGLLFLRDRLQFDLVLTPRS